ncbi:MAG: bifunctional phosphopantothenoylcysteine decarboxylase/phosphopantothenate--cysteine ligase CoaBC [Bacteroidaceae bacterium]|nr:bifunctional phosphopantothenoylcysteine decarboxylase/phosphopantothenate--cysteine ligase CoaBC [Bacteroidaceae bacterium]
MLKGKTILLGVSGSIAAYKMANLASMLVKLHADVHVLMTKNACQFITPVTFETLTGHKCLIDTFDRNFEFQVEHVSLAKKADLFLIAPATANVIGKIASGICDDMLTTTVMACKAPKLVAPAMNTQMWENPILQDNLKKLLHYGYLLIQPAAGRLACGDTGSGKLPSEEVLLQQILLQVALPHDLAGKRVLLTAGPTREAIDPVRFITNHSTGKMGYALAKMACLRGADVTLVSGPVNIAAFPGVEVIPVSSAEDMFQAVKARYETQDILILSSAVADYTPVEYHEQKTKKADADMSLPLKRTQDILKFLGEHRKDGQVLVGFSMETEKLIANSTAKLERKNADLICANSISTGKTGFGVDTNQVTMISRTDVHELPLCSKEETANYILDEILLLNNKQ